MLMFAFDKMLRLSWMYFFFREVGIIAGSVMGVVVFFGIAVSLISCCCCHRNERRGYVKVNEGNMITFCKRVLGKLLHQGTSTLI